MTISKVFGIKIFFIVIIFFVIQLSVLNGCFQIQASEMSKNKLNKKHHLEDGSFKNNYTSPINKPFSDLIKWRWNRTQPEPFNFKLHKNDPRIFERK